MSKDSLNYLIAEECRILLERMLNNKQQIKSWLDSPHEHFDFKSPSEVMQTNPEDVLDYLIWINESSGY